MSRVLAVLLSVYLVLRFMDLSRRGAIGRIWEPRIESYLFLLEVALMALPALLIFRGHTRRPSVLYAAAVMAIFGFVTNRLNVAVTGMERASGVVYLPKWTELAVTLAIIALGFAIFRLAVQYLPVFEEAHEENGAGDAAKAEEDYLLTRA
jgi:Ni/Fe-hydrogenase subunit HybB-like protein